MFNSQKVYTYHSYLFVGLHTVVCHNSSTYMNHLEQSKDHPRLHFYIYIYSLKSEKKELFYHFYVSPVVSLEQGHHIFYKGCLLCALNQNVARRDYQQLYRAESMRLYLHIQLQDSLHRKLLLRALKAQLLIYILVLCSGWCMRLVLVQRLDVFCRNFLYRKGLGFLSFLVGMQRSTAQRILWRIAGIFRHQFVICMQVRKLLLASVLVLIFANPKGYFVCSSYMDYTTNLINHQEQRI